LENLALRIEIQGGRVIDPGNLDTMADIIIEQGKIVKITRIGKTAIRQPESGIADRESRTIDATGKIVCPGFIDMHVHLREPGHEHKETIKTGHRGLCHAEHESGQ
jgi:dihydroorotase